MIKYVQDESQSEDRILNILNLYILLSYMYSKYFKSYVSFVQELNTHDDKNSTTA